MADPMTPVSDTHTPLSASADAAPSAARGRIDLSRYDRRSFDRGAGRLREACWLLVRSLFFLPSWMPGSRLRCWWLRRFGASVGRGVVIKPGVRITMPWRLRIGDHVWIGEEAFLHSLAPITIGANACVSQRAFLCTGSHDYSSAAFDLLTSPILLADGVWIGAAAWVGPGVTAGSHAVLTAGSVATRDMAAYTIYRGNPAGPVRERYINTARENAEERTSSEMSGG